MQSRAQPRSQPGTNRSLLHERGQAEGYCPIGTERTLSVSGFATEQAVHLHMGAPDFVAGIKHQSGGAKLQASRFFLGRSRLQTAPPSPRRPCVTSEKFTKLAQ